MTIVRSPDAHRCKKMRRLKCNLYNLTASGKFVEYESAWRYQKAIAERANLQYKQQQQSVDSILLVQHPSVYTLGRGATPDNIKFKVDENSPHKVVRVERGGEVTWHGPGQLVAYPILNLNNHKRDLHWLTNQLEQTVINTLQHFGIVGERSDVNTGVWVGKNKISAVGLTASRWITMHGIALNVNCDLRNYERIVPCGISQSDRGVCSIQGLHDTLAGHLSGESFAFEDPAHMTPADPVDIHAVAHKWMQEFGNVFNVDIESAHTTPHARGGDSKVVSEEERGRQHDAAVRELDDLVQSFPSIAEQKVQYYVDDVQQ